MALKVASRRLFSLLLLSQSLKSRFSKFEEFLEVNLPLLLLFYCTENYRCDFVARVSFLTLCLLLPRTTLENRTFLSQPELSVPVRRTWPKSLQLLMYHAIFVNCCRRKGKQLSRYMFFSRSARHYNAFFGLNQRIWPGKIFKPDEINHWKWRSNDRSVNLVFPFIPFTILFNLNGKILSFLGGLVEGCFFIEGLFYHNCLTNQNESV